MKKLIYGFALASLLGSFSCTENTESETSTSNHSSDFKPIAHEYSKTDTLRFTKDTTKMIVTGVMKLIEQKDSSKLAPIDVLYYKNGKQLAYYLTEFSVEGGEELANYFEATDSLRQSCEKFFTVNYGYQACGYVQHKITFSVDDKAIYMIAKHESSVDGAYGSGLTFYNMCLETNPKQISSVDIWTEPSEKDENIIDICYKDSMAYTFNGKSWEAKRITEKDKVYRTEQDKF
jgi:hypothetical protein